MRSPCSRYRVRPRPSKAAYRREAEPIGETGERVTITGDPKGGAHCAERLAACDAASVGHPIREVLCPLLMPPNVMAVTGLAFEARIAAGRQCYLCDRTLALAVIGSSVVMDTRQFRADPSWARHFCRSCRASRRLPPALGSPLS
jgi:hypothetical protein